MKKIKLTQGYYATVNNSDFVHLNKYKWYAIRIKTKSNIIIYAARNQRISDKKVIKIYMHRLILEAKMSQKIDHKDFNGINNIRRNIRICTKGQNAFNTRKRQNTLSKYKGVGWYENIKKWTARIGYKGKLIYLGVFHYEKEAAIAYNKKALVLFGKYANINNL